MKKEEIIDVLKYIDSENLVVKPSTYADIAESYLSIISTRRSERRADGSNSKAKEVCPRTGLCDIYEQWGFCPYQCALFNRWQTD